MHIRNNLSYVTAFMTRKNSFVLFYCPSQHNQQREVLDNSSDLNVKIWNFLTLNPVIPFVLWKTIWHSTG